MTRAGPQADVLACLMWQGTKSLTSTGLCHPVSFAGYHRNMSAGAHLSTRVDYESATSVIAIHISRFSGLYQPSEVAVTFIRAALDVIDRLDTVKTSCMMLYRVRISELTIPGVHIHGSAAPRTRVRWGSAMAVA